MNKRKVLLKAVNERESDSLIKESLIRYLSNTEGSEDDKERDLETLVISILNRDNGVSIYSLRELASMYKTEKSPNGVTRQFLIKEIDKADLLNSDAEILGNVYEYLIGQFASETGKKAGE